MTLVLGKMKQAETEWQVESALSRARRAREHANDLLDRPVYPEDVDMHERVRSLRSAQRRLTDTLLTLVSLRTTPWHTPEVLARLQEEEDATALAHELTQSALFLLTGGDG